MQIPIRLTLAFRSTASLGVLLAVAHSTTVLVSTPFLLPLVAGHYGVGLGPASLVSVGQLGGFVAGSWGAGRRLRPRRRVFVATLAIAVTANVLSALLPPFGLLVLLRIISGLTLGVVAWFSWVDVFGDEQRMGDIAVVGPVVGVAAAPALALAAQQGITTLFVVLAVVSFVPLPFNRGTGIVQPPRPKTRRHHAVPAARLVLASLGLFTLGGSAVFQYVVVIGDSQLGLGVDTVAVALSLNALASVPSSRWRGVRGVPSAWMGVTAAAALVVGAAPSAALFIGAIVVWGFAFWMAVPAVFTVLSRVSRYPAERAGDAQAVMAAGRVGGPLVGGVLIDGPGTTILGLVGCAVMLVAAIGVQAARPSPELDSQA